MAQTNTALSDATMYPVYAAKADCMADINALLQSTGNMDPHKLRMILYRISNTDTDNWSGDNEARHDNL